MMMRSLPVSPSRTILRPPGCVGPGRIGSGTTVPSSATVITILFDWSVVMALSGMMMASYGFEPGMRSRPN